MFLLKPSGIKDGWRPKRRFRLPSRLHLDFFDKTPETLETNFSLSNATNFSVLFTAQKFGFGFVWTRIRTEKSHDYQMFAVIEKLCFKMFSVHNTDLSKFLLVEERFVPFSDEFLWTVCLTVFKSQRVMWMGTFLIPGQSL